MEGKNDARLQQALAQVGDEISELAVFGNAQRPPRIAVVPVLNCNFVNMNADSMMAMLRNEVASSATGRLQFLMPGTIDNADYLLTGQFIAESLKTEAIVDLSQYIQVVEERLKNGKSLSVYDDNAGNQIIVNLDAGRRPSILECIAANSQLRMPPNVTKRLSVMLVKADDKAAVYEKMVTLEEKLTEELGRADLVLSGEISGLSKRVQGLASDYLLITMQLVDPVTNELVWEDGYEIKKQSRAGIVYQ